MKATQLGPLGGSGRGDTLNMPVACVPTHHAALPAALPSTTGCTVRNVRPCEAKLHVGSRLLDTERLARDTQFCVQFMDRPHPICVDFVDRPYPISCSFYEQTVPHFVFVLWTDRAPLCVHVMDRPWPILCSLCPLCTLIVHKRHRLLI
jgi:hypothetical protein